MKRANFETSYSYEVVFRADNVQMQLGCQITSVIGIGIWNGVVVVVVLVFGSGSVSGRQIF
jgi:hypothetical protein